MRIRTAPLGFVTGGTLSPQTLNENLGHISQSIDEVASYRYAHHVVRLPFFRDLSTPYTEADSDEIREYVLRLPSRWSIERAYLRYYGTAADTVRVDVYEGGALLVEGLLSVDAITPAGAVSAFSGKRIECKPSTEYAFRLEGEGAFSSQGTYLEIHIRTDRLNVAGDVTPSYAPSRIRASDPRDADVLNGELVAIDDAIDTLTLATTYSRAEVYVLHDLGGGYKSGWSLPIVDSSRTSRHLVGAAVRLVLDAPAGAGGVAAELQVGGSGWREDVPVTVPQGQTTAVASVVLDEHISKAGGNPGDPMADGYVQIASLASSTIAKAQVTLIYD